VDKKILLQCIDITKKFPGMVALDRVNLEVYEGEIVGLIGENGAGKSTLLKIIMGLQPQSSGTMKIHGEEYLPKDTREANFKGVGMVFQEQSLVNNLTVAQNIFFGQEKKYKKFGIAINFRKMNADTKVILEKVGIDDIMPEKRINELNFATRQMVEVAKVFNSVQISPAEKYLILLDEPTSLLNENEIKQLFSHMRKLKEDGHAIVFVSHRLDEVLEISDRIYVFKDGKGVGDVLTKNADESSLYKMMVGRSTTGEYFKVDRQVKPKNDTLLEVKNLSLRGVFRDVSFKLKKGEVLGFCGVIGSGKEEVCAVLIGDEKPSTGEIIITGKECNFNAPSYALDKGMISIPKERRFEGIIGILPVSDNIVVSGLKHIRKGVFLSKKSVAGICNEWVKKLSIKCTGIDAPVQSLSGGNAQKVIFARAFTSQSDIFILNHPTRGVDVGAKEEIYNLIRDITEQGKGVILLGDTLDECIGLSNRVIVMKDGLVTKHFDAPPNNKPEQEDIIKYMM